MAKIDFLTAKMKEHKVLSEDFFDNMIGPPVGYFFSQQELDYIKYIITHNRNDIKLTMLNAIMKSKGFSRLSAGTNRIVYRFLDDPSFVLKVAIDRVGLQDNLLEYKNQQYLKPYVCKIFDTTKDGLMATIERVYPITSKEEFTAVQEEVFYLLTTKIIGRTVADDVGKAYFRNYGLRANFGVVLLDYPYVYPIAEEKLFCSHVDPKTGIRCTGLIDYDDGFNALYCRKCGTRYLASDLEDKNASNDIITSIGGKYPMKIRVTMKDGTVVEPIRSSTVIKPQTFKSKNKELKIRVLRNGIPVEEVKEEPKVEETKEEVKVEEPVMDAVEESKEEETVENNTLPGTPEKEEETVTVTIPNKIENQVITCTLCDKEEDDSDMNRDEVCEKSNQSYQKHHTSETKNSGVRKATNSKFIPSPGVINEEY